MADEYDMLASTNPVVVWLRDLVRAMVERQIQPGDSILEINCGSGLDAAYFAAQGYRVHATDIAPGMLESLAVKAAGDGAGGRLTYENLSNTELRRVEGGPYDLVFSNLGGLNCLDDLAAFAKELPHVLKPDGRVVLVVMPPFCPWETLQLLRGHFRTALRRFKPEGVEANVGGRRVRTWYHAPGKLARSLGQKFEVVEIRSFCVFAPPPFFAGFISRHGVAVERLQRVDERLGGVWPINNFGDFFILVSRRVG